MSQSLVDVEYNPPLATLIINRPDVLNAYNGELLGQLEAELSEVIAEDKIKAIILTGKGTRAFSVGADINWLEKLTPEEAGGLSRRGQQICADIEKAPKAVIAAVNGYALGGGMELALACDLRIASTRARFGQPEVSLGIIPGFDGSRRLPQIVGVGLAKEILFTGNILDAQEANQIGLVNRLVTPRDLIRESKELALKITEQSSQAIKMVKKAINFGIRHQEEKGSEFESRAFERCFTDAETRKRIKELKKVIGE